MFRQHTTFVIGAGASAEFGLPVGAGLARAIKKSASVHNADAKDPYVVDPEFYACFERVYPRGHADRASALRALETIHNGLHTAVSIDAFIHRFRSDKHVVKLGKMLIALEIARAERQSTLMPETWASLEDPRSRKEKDRMLVNPDDTWLGHFFRTMIDGVENPDDIGKNLSIICFNYDRCIEHYLTQSIAFAYRRPTHEARAIVERMIIIHPYGTLGKLSEMNVVDGDSIPFGFEADFQTPLERIADNIITYTEQTHQKDTLRRIHDAISINNMLVFLGFGFNNQNLDLLRVKALDPPYKLETRNIYTTGFGTARQVSDTLTRRILDIFVDIAEHASWKEQVHIEFDQTCVQLFNTHQMNLSSFTQNYFSDNNDVHYIRYRGGEESKTKPTSYRYAEAP
ncbi:SIR2 family protein [Rhizobium ruizarguesonis]